MDAIAEKAKGLAGLQETALSILKEYGASTELIAAQYGNITAARLNALDFLTANEAAEEEIFSALSSYLKAKDAEDAYLAEFSKEDHSAQEREKEYLESVTSLRKSELSLMKARGDNIEAQISKEREIINALTEQGEYLQSIGADQTELNALAAEIYTTYSEIDRLRESLEEQRDAQQENRKKYLSDVVDLRESELSLLKAMGASDGQILEKHRQIQDAVAEEAEYLRAIGASQENLNARAAKYLGILSDTLRIQQERLDAAKDEAGAYLDETEAAMLAPLQAQLDLLEEQRNARTEEEKLLAVEKARIALENAQRQRSVRIYNAATGQFEWIANQKTVKSALDALDALDKANEDLSEYYAQKDYERAVAALELQIDYTEEAFDALRESLDYVAKKIKAGEMTYRERLYPEQLEKRL